MKIFLASHGKFASGILSSLEILYGNTSKTLTVYDAYMDESSIYEVLDEFFKNVHKEDTVILLSDLYGGSVNQSMIQYLERENTFLVAGVNLALVLELVASPVEINKRELIEIINQSKEMLKLVELSNLEINVEEEDDFF